MDPHSFIARAEAQRWVGIAEKLLMGHDLVGSKTFAIRARDSDPRLEAADQILAVADTLLAAEKRVVGNNGNHQPDYYAILQLVRFVQDAEHIASQYRRLAVLLNPHQNRFPYADQAFQLVNDAWAVLSNPMRKSMYDSELDFPPQQQQMDNLGFNLEQQHHQQHQQHHQHQQQQQHNFFSINHMGAGHEQELPEQPQTFQTRLQQSHQQQQLQQHNFLSQPNPVRPLPVREQEHLFHHREQEQLFQPQVQPFQVTSSSQQQTRTSSQPPQSQPPIQSPSRPQPAAQQSPFSWPQTPHLSQPHQQNQQQAQLQQKQIKQEQQLQQQIKQEQLQQMEQQKQQQLQEQRRQQEQLKQQQLQQERLKQEQLQQERLKQEQLQQEQLKQQQLLQEQRRQQEEQKHQQMLQEQRRQQEEQKQQQLLLEQQKQQQLLQEQRRQQEEQKQQQLLQEQLRQQEEQKQQQLLQEQMRQQEEQKQQQLLQEQRRQQEEQKQQQLLQEQQRQQEEQKQQQLKEEQKKQEQLLQEQQRQQEEQKQQQLQQEQQKQEQLLQEQLRQQEFAKHNAAPVSNQVNSSNGAREEETEAETETADDDVDDSPTFWTACPYCFYMYEYPRVYAECTLCCDNCKRAFQAVRISSPPPIIEGQDAYFCCWASIPVGVRMSHLQNNNSKGTNSKWTPFSPFYDASNNAQNHLNCNAAPKENFVNKSSGPRIYVDDITEDVFIDVSEPSDDSDFEWDSTKKQKLKRSKKGLNRGFKERVQVLALRAQDGKDGSVKNLNHDILVQEGAKLPALAVAENNMKAVGTNPRKQSGRVAKEMGKLDLNVEFNNNEGEEPAPRNRGHGHGNGEGEEDNVGFFEGLDEFLSSLPILSVVNEEKVKA